MMCLEFVEGQLPRIAGRGFDLTQPAPTIASASLGEPRGPFLILDETGGVARVELGAGDEQTGVVGIAGDHGIDHQQIGGRSLANRLGIVVVEHRRGQTLGHPRGHGGDHRRAPGEEARHDAAAAGTAVRGHLELDRRTGNSPQTDLHGVRPFTGWPDCTPCRMATDVDARSPGARFTGETDRISLPGLRNHP